MISFRRADLLDRYKNPVIQMIPGLGKTKSYPIKLDGNDLIGKTVTVRDPTDRDLWDHSFDGRVTKFYEATRPLCYEVEDQEGNSFTMERGDFDVIED